MNRYFRRMGMACVLCLGMASAIHAVNRTQTVSSVSTPISVVRNVDYVITGTTPFESGGEVDIQNTDHATIVFRNIRPSEVISKWLKYVKINGVEAKDGVNCQVKMYAQGSIVMPYEADFKPLTCYTGKDFTGNSSSDYGLGHTGGYMNTLTDEQLNNKIRSFILKRGYMVTFAVGTAGWGYSRCFIADAEDLEIASLPNVLDGKISSYRIFKWYDAQKKGLAADMNLDTNNALKSSWTYTWGVGGDMGPDVECVPHHIKEGWPSITDMGAQNFSPHAKTNNEPANNADDGPATVDQVLANWQDLMRTGLRLCSPSSHDGGYKWLEDFMKAIDERGWRCDILDMHAYWVDGNYNNLGTYYNKYKRPIWLSEMLWGASWNHNGIFGAVSSKDYDSNSTDNQTKNLNGMSPILAKLNGLAYVERYAYWNGERACSRVFYDGALTSLGKYYADMNTGIAFNHEYEFVPTVVIKKPSVKKISYSGNEVTIDWTDPNGDMVDKVMVQYMREGSNVWTTLGNVVPKDKSNGDDVTYSMTYTLSNAESCVFRVVDTAASIEYSSGAFIQSTGWITALPDNYEDFYYLIYSQEASSQLCWTVVGTDVYYHKPATIGTDFTQIWQIEPNDKSEGYVLRNLSTYDYAMCSPNSWNFVTNDGNYRASADATGFMPEYMSGGYWVMRNCKHANNYVGLWDNDKQFGVGERLAGNRNSIAAADHLKIYAIRKTEFNERRLIRMGETNANYTMMNPNLTWGAEPDMRNSNGAAYCPIGWKFISEVSGWNDCFITKGKVSTGKEVNTINAWAGTINRIEMMQTINHLPNGIYKLTAELATTNGYQRNETKTAIYGNPNNWGNIARSYNLEGKGDDTYNKYTCYVIVDNNTLTIGVRSDGTWLKFGDFNLTYVCSQEGADFYTLGDVDNARALQVQYLNTGAPWVDLSEYKNCRNLQIDPTAENAIVKMAATATVDESYYAKNIIIGDVCKDLVIADEQPLSVGSPFVAKSLTYTRNDDANVWHELFMPFVLTSNSNVTAATVASVEGTTLNYRTGKSMANMPSLVKFSGKTIYGSDVEVVPTAEYASEQFEGYYTLNKAANPLRWRVVDGKDLGAFALKELPALVKGDVNGDGRISAADVTALVNILMQNATDQYGTADVNGDAKVDYHDVNTLVNKILGK